MVKRGLVSDGPLARGGILGATTRASRSRQPLIAPAVMPRTNHSDRKR